MSKIFNKNNPARFEVKHSRNVNTVSHSWPENTSRKCSSKLFSHYTSLLLVNFPTQHVYALWTSASHNLANGHEIEFPTAQCQLFLQLDNFIIQNKPQIAFCVRFSHATPTEFAPRQRATSPRGDGRRNRRRSRLVRG